MTPIGSASGRKEERMPRQGHPWVAKKHVSRGLQDLRGRTGRTQEEVANSLEWSTSKLIRIENSTVGISISDLKTLLREYQASEDETELLITKARASREAPWDAVYEDVLNPVLRRLIAYESAARIIRQFQLQVVPGLLQTEAYARALLERFAPGEHLDQAVALRMERQQHVLGDDPADLDVIIDESVLMRPGGGPQAMRKQIEYLIDMAGEPHISIAVLPLATGVHIGLAGSFTLMNLDTEVEADTVVHVETERGEDHLLRRDDEVATKYWARYEDLNHRAEVGKAAMAMLTRHLAHYRGQ
jgi:transcriptional regulator with XRE-family HTH domain